MRGGLRLACLSVLLLLSPAVLSAGSQPPDVPGQADAFSDEDDCGDFAGRDAESVVLSEHECDEDDASAAPAAPGPASRRPKRRTRYCAAQKEFNDACRRKCDAGGSAFKSMTAQGWLVQPPEPSMQAVAPGSRLDPCAYWLKGWGGWVPEQLFPRQCSAPPCPICTDGGLVNAAAAKWQKTLPRCVLSTRQRGGFYFLDAKTYRCGSCGTPFLGSNPDSVAKLPTKVKLEFNVLQGKRTAVDTHLAWRILSEWTSPIPAARIAYMINHELRREFWALQSRYGASLIAMSDTQLQQSVVAPRDGSSTLDSHIVTGLAAQQLHVQQAAAAAATAAATAAAPAAPRPFALSVLKGFGPKKLAEYKVKSISTVEQLARLKPDGVFALAVTGRTGATQQIREEALRTVRGHVALAQAFLISKNRWPLPANEAPPAVAHGF